MAARKDPTPAIAAPFLGLLGTLPEGCSLVDVGFSTPSGDSRAEFRVAVRVDDLKACPVPLREALGKPRLSTATKSIARVEVRQGSLQGDVLIEYLHEVEYEGDLHPIEVGACRLPYDVKDRMASIVAEKYNTLYCSLSTGEVFYARSYEDAETFKLAVEAADGEAILLDIIHSSDL